MARRAKAKRFGDNGGPPLEDERQHVPEWGRGGVRRYFEWRGAWRGAWKKIPPEIAVRRATKAEAIGLTYEEYTLELLERGRYLQPEDADAIRQVQARRKRSSR